MCPNPLHTVCLPNQGNCSWKVTFLRWHRRAFMIWPVPSSFFPAFCSPSHTLAPKTWHHVYFLAVVLTQEWHQTPDEGVGYAFGNVQGHTDCVFGGWDRGYYWHLMHRSRDAKHPPVHGRIPYKNMGPLQLPRAPPLRNTNLQAHATCSARNTLSSLRDSFLSMANSFQSFRTQQRHHLL